MTFAGWDNRSQQDAIEYLKEENRVLREELVARRIRFTDDQPRRLAAKAKALCRKNLKGIAELVTPDTLLRYLRSCEEALVITESLSRLERGGRFPVRKRRGGLRPLSASVAMACSGRVDDDPAGSVSAARARSWCATEAAC